MIQEEILRLKKEKDAVIFAHYYVAPEVQEMADYIGDSFFLSKKAVELKEKIIVFCGVEFMGESAKMLNPDKKVLMPDLTADCPMAHMVTKETVDEARAKYDDLAVVCYVNSTAEIKSWSDVCVTSANAVKIVKKLPQKNILFIPDKNLAHFVDNDGYCPRHEFMDAQEIAELKAEHPDAEVLVHPECNADIIKQADYVGSTSGIINYAAGSKNKKFIIGTVKGVIYELLDRRPDAEFYFPKTEPICVNMAKITLEKLRDVLLSEDKEVMLPPEDINEKAKLTLERMLEYAK